jgi:hypothetical protein
MVLTPGEEKATALSTFWRSGDCENFAIVSFGIEEHYAFLVEVRDPELH